MFSTFSLIPLESVQRPKFLEVVQHAHQRRFRLCPLLGSSLPRRAPTTRAHAPASGLVGVAARRRDRAAGGPRLP